jgi:hypothetical protein
MMKFNERKLYSMFKRAIPIPLRGRLDLSDWGDVKFDARLLKIHVLKKCLRAISNKIFDFESVKNEHKLCKTRKTERQIKVHKKWELRKPKYKDWKFDRVFLMKC